MNIKLTKNEIRILGVLIEKESTTPENYPLSLNSLVNGCNQKTNREPVLTMSEDEALDALESLIGHTFVARRGGASSRVDKFAHRLSNRLADEYSFEPPELAVLAVLMLRGAQTIGEIRVRCARIHAFASADEVAATLDRLMGREDGPFVTKLPRRPGRKEVRFAELWAGELDLNADEAAPIGSPGLAETDSELAQRVADLEQIVAEYGARIGALERQIGPQEGGTEVE